MSNPYDKAVSTTSSVLGPTLKFKGELKADEDLLIQGEIHGSINHSSNLTVGKEGKLKANVKAAFISIEGEVDGDIAGVEAVVVKDTANVSGNLISPVVTLREGSKFNGSIDMSGKNIPEAVSPRFEEQATSAKAKKTEAPAKPAKTQKDVKPKTKADDNETVKEELVASGETAANDSEAEESTEKQADTSSKKGGDKQQSVDAA
jgi:cytoskeletal protein CcmA (bactofilin family)